MHSVDFHIDQAALHGKPIAIAENQFVVLAAAHQLSWILGVRPLHKNLQCFPQKALRTLFCHLIHHSIEPVEPVCLNQICHLQPKVVVQSKLLRNASQAS